MYDEELKLIKDMLGIITQLNREKKDYLKSLVHICIAIIISFTIIICCFYTLYFTI